MQRVPFNEDEMKVVGTYPVFNTGARRNNNPPEKLNSPITPRENILMMFKKEMPLWMPLKTDIFTFVPKVVPDNVARALIMDAEGLEENEKGGCDMFGTEWVYVPEVGGSMVRPGKPRLTDANEWYEKIVFPDIDKLDFEASYKKNELYVNNGGLANSVWIMNGFFERLISFMDFEGAAMAMIDEDQQDAVKELYDKLADMYIKMVDKFKKYYKMDILLFHDDWGSQANPFFSLDTCMEMVVPAMRKLTDYCHANDIFFDLHSCGKGERLAPAMIEAGVDTWSGQPMNDKDALYRDYGDKLIIGMSAPVVPMDATRDEAMVVAKALVDKYAPNFEKKPVIFATQGSTPLLKECIYEYSRKVFNA